MNISYNWLKRYISLPDDAEKVATILTSIGLEVGTIEQVQSIRGGLKGLVVGHVLTCVEHPNSDHLHITTGNLLKHCGDIGIRKFGCACVRILCFNLIVLFAHM